MPMALLVSGWVLSDKTVRMEVVVPPNTSATIVFLNSRAAENVLAGSYVFVVELNK